MADYERIGGEPIIFQSIFHHQGSITGDSMRAKGHCTIGFFDIKADVCFEPLPRFINERE